MFSECALEENSTLRKLKEVCNTWPWKIRANTNKTRAYTLS